MRRIQVTALTLALGVAGVLYATQSSAQSTPEGNAQTSCCSMKDCCDGGSCNMNGECCSCCNGDSCEMGGSCCASHNR